jgi:hypothetical protein
LEKPAFNKSGFRLLLPFAFLLFSFLPPLPDEESDGDEREDEENPHRHENSDEFFIVGVHS